MLAVAAFAFASLLIAFSLVAHAWRCRIRSCSASGFTMILNNALANATLQHSCPNELRGRMMAAYSFVVVGLSQVVGSFVAGRSRT